jgi:hypothetical protein
VGADRLSRFIRGERGISLDAAEELCRVLHLGLSPYAQPAAEPVIEAEATRKKGKRKG